MLVITNAARQDVMISSRLSGGFVVPSVDLPLHDAAALSSKWPVTVTSIQSFGSTPGWSPVALNPGLRIEKNESVVFGLAMRNLGCGHVLPSQSGSMVQPISTPHVASGASSRAGNVSVLRPKQARPAVGSRSWKAAKLVGGLGHGYEPALTHGVPSLSAAAIQPNGK